MDRRRRQLLQGLGALGVGPFWPLTAAAEERQMRRIPSTGERIPAIGLGTWQTFNAAPFTDTREQCVEVLRQFFERGGSLVDSSPMYMLAESVIGHALDRIGGRPPLFSATKVWIVSQLAGIGQMKASAALWGLPGFDLMQIHNMLDWEVHLETLKEWQAEKRIRYIGITTSHGRRHEAMERVIRERPEFDFVQFSYSIADRKAEERLLPAAAEQGKAVIINRPFRTGALFERVRGKPLPGWAAAIGCNAWSQVFLKWVISHPAVTCAIPATSRVDHLLENMQALRGPLPDAALRARMAADFRKLA
jgi:diketogulonate reductase-like aldo/keto reductase